MRRRCPPVVRSRALFYGGNSHKWQLRVDLWGLRHSGWDHLSVSYRMGVWYVPFGNLHATNTSAADEIDNRQPRKRHYCLVFATTKIKSILLLNRTGTCLCFACVPSYGMKFEMEKNKHDNQRQTTHGRRLRRRRRWSHFLHTPSVYNCILLTRIHSFGVDVWLHCAISATTRLM